MQLFDLNSFRQRVQQAQTPDDYQRLKEEFSAYVGSLSSDEKTQLRQAFNPLWKELNNRVDKLIDEVKQIDQRVRV